LPAAVWIVDPSVEPLRVEAQRIRHAEHDPLTVLQGEQAIGQIPRVDGHVRAKAERAKLIDPGVIARAAAPPAVNALELRDWLGIERPAFWAVLTGSGWAVQRTLALASIEAGEVAAGQGRPDNAITINVHTPESVAGVRHAWIVPRNRVDLRERG